MFSFPLVFISLCFCFFRSSDFLTSLFLHCLSGTLFLCCYRKCYGYKRTFFTLRRFLPYFLSWFYQGFPGASSSALKVAGLSTEVWNTDLARLFLWIIEYSAKGITCRFYLYVRGCYGLLLELPFSGFELPILVILIHFLDVIIIH